MKTFIVYHYDMEKYLYSFGQWMEVDRDAGSRRDSDGPSFPGEYKLVAVVLAPDIDKVFELTNHIDHDWRENENVLPSHDARRSTSTGDIVVEFNEDDPEKNTIHLCASFGWEEIKNNSEIPA